ncbi:MAG: hypothetical protein K2Q97_04450 [Burkholderiaceae bacterium]|nr:hypothetical protein [Burkholderiaceae bacterium]
MTNTFARSPRLLRPLRLRRALPAAALALLVTGCAVVPGDPYYDPSPRYPVMEQPGVIYGAPSPYYRAAPIYQNAPVYRAPQPVYVAPPPTLIFNGRLGYDDRRFDRRDERYNDRRDNNGWRERDHDHGRDNDRNRPDNGRVNRGPDHSVPADRNRQDNDRRNDRVQREVIPSQAAPVPSRAEPRMRNDVNRSSNRQDQP